MSLLLRDIQSNRLMASALNKLEGGDACASCELSSPDLPALRCRSCRPSANALPVRSAALTNVLPLAGHALHTGFMFCEQPAGCSRCVKTALERF